MTTLKHLDEKLQRLLEQIDLAEGTEDTEANLTLYGQLLAEYMSTEEEAVDKIDRIAAVIKECEYWAKARKEELERYRKMVKRDEETMTFLKTYLKDYMDNNGITKLKTRRFNLSIAKNGGLTPVELDGTVDPKDYPSDCRIVEYKPDIKAIRNHLEAGDDIEFARWGERGTHLRIK